MVSAPFQNHQPAAVMEGGPKWAFYLLIVFWVLDFVRPAILHQLRFNMIIAVVLPLAWIAAPRKPHFNIIIAYFVYFSFCCLQVPIASNNFWAYMTARIVFVNAVFGISASWLMSVRSRLSQGTKAWVLIMSYVALYALLNDGKGTGGFLGDENDLGVACVTVLPFVLFGIRDKRGRWRYLSLLLTVVVVAAIVSTGSRGTFVGLIATVVYCWWISPKKVRNIGVAVFAALVFVLSSPTKYLEELQTITDTEESTAKSRRFLWETAFAMWLDYPIMGVGGGGFNFLAGLYQPTDYTGRQFQERDWSGKATHSLYFQLLSESGVVGVGIYLFIIFASLRLMKRVRKQIADDPELPDELRREARYFGSAVAAGTVGFLGAGAFVSIAYYPYAWLLSGFAMAASHALEQSAAAARATNQRKPEKSAQIVDVKH